MTTPRRRSPHDPVFKRQRFARGYRIILMDILSGFSAAQMSWLFCAIVLALVPLTIWACHDLDRRRAGRLLRKRLRRISLQVERRHR
jgi:hypothetical protein